MGTITQNLEKLVAAKNAIAAAIAAKGGTVGANDGFEEFAMDIMTISSGEVVPVPNTNLSMVRITSWPSDWTVESFANYTGAHYMDDSDLPQAVSNPYTVAAWIIYGADTGQDKFKIVSYTANGDYYSETTVNADFVKTKIYDGKIYWYFIETN